MKKLMIATMVAALSAVSFAGACDDTCACTTDCVYAYEFIMLVKSTEGKTTAVVKESPCGCEECGGCCYRKPRMRKYAGFVFGTVGTGSDACSSGCGCLPFYKDAAEGDDTFADGWNQLFWDVRTKKAVWDGEDSTSGATLAFDFVDAIGYQSRETVEAVGAFTVPTLAEGGNAGVMTIAGFGSRGKKGNGKIMVRSISGFCAGTLPCYCTASVASEENPCESKEEVSLAYGWYVCSDKSMCPADNEDAVDITGGCTAAYGKWTLKWNATAQAKLTANYAAAVLVKPGYDGALAAAMDEAGLIGGGDAE